MFLIDAIKKNKKKYLSFNHEQAAAIAAEGYTRLDPKSIGIAVVTSGPGATNAITAVAGAWIESLPLIVISGQVKTSDMMKVKTRQHGPQELNIIDIIKPITKFSKVLTGNSTLKSDLEKAYIEATSGRKGPVWLDVPLDVQSKKVKIKKERIKKIKTLKIENKINTQCNYFFEKLKNSKRPLVMVGHGVRTSGSARLCKKFIEKFCLPSVFTWNAKDILEFDSKFNLGSPGVVSTRNSNFAIQNCDLIIFLGSRLNLINAGFDKKNFAKNAKKRFFVDIDKNELKIINGKKDYKINCDVNNFLKIINKKNLKKNLFDSWVSFSNKQKKKFTKIETKKFKKNKNKLNHYLVVDRLSKIFSQGDLVVTGSSGLAIEIFYTFFQNKKNQRLFLTSGLGSMGYGLPAAIGACVKFQKKTFLLESDGSLMFNLQELATVKSYDLPLTIFVFNNSGYASIRNTQRNYFNGRYVGTGPEDNMFYPRFSDIAMTFDFKYFEINKLSQLNYTNMKKFRKFKRVIVDIKLDKNEILQPKVSAIFKSGKIYSMPLEDMSPLLDIRELKENLINKVDKTSIAVRRK